MSIDFFRKKILTFLNNVGVLESIKVFIEDHLIVLLYSGYHLYIIIFWVRGFATKIGNFWKVRTWLRIEIDISTPTVSI